MTGLPDLTLIPPHQLRSQPLCRTPVTEAGWTALAHALARGEFDLVSLWASPGAVHMALIRPKTHEIAVASLDGVIEGFPSVGRHHPPAQRLERAITDLFGYDPYGATDARPWLDHGRWPIAHPLGPADTTRPPEPYPFLPVEGESLHQVPVGPVHAGIIEPGHFRFTAQGETVVRLEERFGYTHKGIDRLMQGASLTRGAELACRVSGDSSVAYAWSFAQAAEAALSTQPSPRALWLRTVMLELERLANHLGDIGAICNDAAFAMMLAHCATLREEVLRATEATFGQRFARDKIVPGGVTTDLTPEGTARLTTVLHTIRSRFPALVNLYDSTPSLLDRTVGAGHLTPALAHQFAAGGFIGRASGRGFDTRRDLPHAPYDRLSFEVPLREDGDVNARIWIRIREVEQSCTLIDQLLSTLPDGPTLTHLPEPTTPTEGIGLIEGFRGDIFTYLALAADGTIARCHLRDPSWFQWPLLEAAIEGNIIADFPLCNKSFNCSYSGVDL